MRAAKNGNTSRKLSGGGAPAVHMVNFMDTCLLQNLKNIVNILEAKTCPPSTTNTMWVAYEFINLEVTFNHQGEGKFTFTAKPVFCLRQVFVFFQIASENCYGTDGKSPGKHWLFDFVVIILFSFVFEHSGIFEK